MFSVDLGQEKEVTISYNIALEAGTYQLVQISPDGTKHVLCDSKNMQADERRKSNMINILMNTSMIDEKWCVPVLKKALKPGMKVCVVALSFFDDTKTGADWNRQFAPGQGHLVPQQPRRVFRYGIRDEDISWIRYFRIRPRTCAGKSNRPTCSC